jgi:putative membrane protein
MLVLPFTLVREYRWQLIPFTMVASFVVFGLEAIAREIEDPMGHDKSDLPLDRFCAQFKHEVLVGDRYL